MPDLYARRRHRNTIVLVLSIGATVIGLGWLVLILGTLVYEGISGLSLAVFTEMTPPPGSAGGLLNAIIGSLMMTVLAVAIGTPIGILAGTYLAEYGAARQARHGGALHQRHPAERAVDRDRPVRLRDRGGADGAFLGLGRRGRAGGHRHAGGGAHHRGHADPGAERAARGRGGARHAARPCDRHVSYRAARAGMVTGVLLAVARISGETAPLLFTALNNQFFSTDLNAPMASLPVVIFQFALSPYADWQRLAWTGALLITVAVLALSIIARALAGSRKTS